MTATERDAAGNKIGSTLTKIEEQTMVIPVTISDGLTVDVVGKTIGSIVTVTVTVTESKARVVPVEIDGVTVNVETETRTVGL